METVTRNRSSASGDGLPAPLQGKYLVLKEKLRGLESVLVAYSGGVDSALLARVAHDVLGDSAVALTAVSASLAAEERAGAADLARTIGIRHLEVESGEFENAEYLRNSADRCFHCKRELFSVAAREIQRLGLRSVVYGAITDDLRDVRPGMRAAEAAGARAPLLEAGFSKEDVRTLSRFLGLAAWDKPAAPCLSSRVPHGNPIRIGTLRRVERLEAFLRRSGFQVCRVRVDGESARIEVEPARVRDLLCEPLRAELVEEGLRAGFNRVSVDLQGYRDPQGGGAAPAGRAV